MIAAAKAGQTTDGSSCDTPYVFRFQHMSASLVGSAVLYDVLWRYEALKPLPLRSHQHNAVAQLPLALTVTCAGLMLTWPLDQARARLTTMSWRDGLTAQQQPLRYRDAVRDVLRRDGWRALLLPPPLQLLRGCGSALMLVGFDLLSARVYGRGGDA